MARTVRYGKPSITNLPSELGMNIINTINKTPPINERKLRREVKKVEDRIMKGLKKEKNDK